MEKQMSAVDLRLLLLEAERCCWKGFELSCYVQNAIDDQMPMSLIVRLKMDRDKCEERVREIVKLVDAVGFTLDYDSSGAFWYLSAKEVDVIEADTAG
jgi:hypothetical protein